MINGIYILVHGGDKVRDSFILLALCIFLSSVLHTQSTKPELSNPFEHMSKFCIYSSDRTNQIVS